MFQLNGQLSLWTVFHVSGSIIIWFSPGYPQSNASLPCLVYLMATSKIDTSACIGSALLFQVQQQSEQIPVFSLPQKTGNGRLIMLSGHIYFQAIDWTWTLLGGAGLNERASQWRLVDTSKWSLIKYVWKY